MALSVSSSANIVIPPDASAAEFAMLVERRKSVSVNSEAQAGADAKAPKLDEYAEIEEPGKNAPDTIRYKKNGETGWTVVSKATSPALYEQVVGDQKKFAELQKSKANGYTIAGKDDKPPALGDYSAIEKYSGWADGAPLYDTNGVIHYEVKQSDGAVKKYVVTDGINPGLYAQVKHDGIIKELIGVYTTGDHPFRLAGADEKAPAFDDVVPGTWISDDEYGVITFDTVKGDKVVVFKDINAGLYDTIKGMFTAHAGLATGSDGYQRPGPGDNGLEIAQVGPPGEFGEGVIRFSTKDGRKFIVNKFTDPVLYSQAVANYESTKKEEVDDIRAKFDLGAVDDLDILTMSTGEHSDPKDDKSPLLNVSDYAITKLLEDYRKGVEDGTYAKDSDQAKLVRLLEAKAAYANGRDIIPYLEAGFGGSNNTDRQFGDPVTLTDDDMQQIIDGNALDGKLAELLGKESISKDYDAKMKLGLEKIPNKDKIKTDLVAMLESENYIKYLAEMDKKDLKHMASLDTNRMLASLALINPDQATKTSQKLMMNTLTYELNNIDPSKISEENKDLATKDLLQYMATLLKGGSNIMRTGMGSFEKFLAEAVADKTQVTQIRKIIEEMFKDGRVDVEGDAALNKINAAIDKFVPGDNKSNFQNFFSKAASAGYLGSLAGGLSVFSGIYQLVANGGALAATPLQRLAIANNFVSFLSVGSHFVTLGDKIFSSVGKTGLADFMGLSSTMPEIWGKKGLYNVEMKSPFTSSLRDEVSSVANRMLSDVSMSDKYGVSTDAYDGLSNLFDDENAARTGTPGSTTPTPDQRSFSSKIAASALKVIGATTDFAGGVIDIVLGAYSIKSGIASGDGLEKAGGALQVISGAVGLGAGAVGIAGLFGGIGIASTLAGPLFLVGAVLAVIGGIIGMFVDHNKKQAATDKEGQWFKDLAADGLLQSDWGDKVEYARYETYSYGGRDAPDDKSIYEFQKAEWDHFKATPGKDGSSRNRLDNTLHIDYNEDKLGMPDEPMYPWGGGV